MVIEQSPQVGLKEKELLKKPSEFLPPDQKSISYIQFNLIDGKPEEEKEQFQDLIADNPFIKLNKQTDKIQNPMAKPLKNKQPEVD